MYKKFTEPVFRWGHYVPSDLILKMKLTVILIIVALVQVRAETFAQNLSLNVQNATLSTVITTLREQTSVDFLYKNSDVKDFKPVTVDLKNKSLPEILDVCFKNQNVTYKIENKTVLIEPKPAATPLLLKAPIVTAVTVNQAIHITGKVIDSATHQTIPGVNVALEGTNSGTVTDARGVFAIDVPDANAVLRFSFVGYRSQSIVVGSRTNLTVIMSSAESKLNEVVVVGYGTRTKGEVTGAISTVKSDVFENRPTNNVFDALEGEIPGVTITRGSGQPGNQLYTLQIRGYSSINGNTPLVLIDGVPGDISTINPNDIAQISVLKDAAAAIYGNRAADGVILVTTKHGRKGPLLVDYTANVAVKQPMYLKKMMNTLQYAEFQNDGLINAGIPGFPQSVFDNIKNNAPVDTLQGWNYGITNYPGFYGYTDWNKVIYKDALQEIHNLSISGGGENHTFLASAGYDHDGGNLRFGNNYSDRYNLRFNNDMHLLKNFSLQSRTSIENTITKTPSMIVNALTNVVRQFPYQPVYNPEGEFYGYQGYENPAQSLSQGGEATAELTRINTNFQGNYTVFDGLTITAQAAIRLDYSNNNSTSPTFTRYNWDGNVQDIRQNPNSATYANGKTTYQLYQVYADYTHQFGADNKIDLTLGTSLEKTNNQGQSITGYNFPNNDILTLNLADRTNVAYSNFTGYLNNEALNSYFGRFSYSFKNKIILDLTARSDGSSKFAPSERWSEIFPSAALAYNLSQEKFIKKLNFFDQFKIRASYGKSGNQDISTLGLFDYVPLITIGGVYPLGSPNAGLQGAIANPASTNRTWETITNKNIGIDLQMFKSRLSFSFDYFNKINNDMLVAIAVPATFGATPPSANQGKLVTKGFETTISWRDHIGQVRYSITAELSDNNDKLVQLKNSDNYIEGLNFARQGYPIYSYFGYVYNGIIKTQAQLDAYKKLQGVPSRIGIGDVMYKDVDGDGVLSEYGDKSKGHNGDMVYLGSLVPRYTYSSNITVAYKNFDLAVYIQGVGKRMIQYQGNIATPNTFFWPTLAYYYGKTWSPSNPNAQYPRNIVGSAGYDDIRNYDYQTSSLVMQNAAYLRFKTITIGYNLPASFAEAVKMKSARLYFSGEDLFTISKGTLGGNFDPEDGNRDESTYPFNRVYSIGVDVKF